MFGSGKMSTSLVEWPQLEESSQKNLRMWFVSRYGDYEYATSSQYEKLKPFLSWHHRKSPPTFTSFLKSQFGGRVTPVQFHPQKLPWGLTLASRLSLLHSITNVIHLGNWLIFFVYQLCKHRVREWHRQPFSNSVMGRELLLLGLDDPKFHNLIVATSHLESPCPGPPTWDQMYSKERVQQLKVAFQALGAMRNVVFLGDMNWTEKTDDAPALPTGWFDAWLRLREKEVCGLACIKWHLCFWVRVEFHTFFWFVDAYFRKGWLTTVRRMECWKVVGSSWD